MRHAFLRHHSGSTGLLLFFSGWGSEPCMFSPEPAEEPGRDILMLWDYRDMTLNPDLLRGYGKISLLAWSMGVWAAGETLRLSGLDDAVNGRRIAVNGTPFPIDDSRGIPTAIFDGTLNGLSERTLSKFRRRMCGSSEALDDLLGCGLSRTAEELHGELAAIGERVRDTASNHIRWDKAVVGQRDMIFPTAGQRNAWKELNVPVIETESAHYDAGLFRRLLYQEGSWTRL